MVAMAEELRATRPRGIFVGMSPIYVANLGQPWAIAVNHLRFARGVASLDEGGLLTMTLVADSEVSDPIKALNVILSLRRIRDSSADDEKRILRRASSG